ncbi:unnamed protein product [Oncorhynchus mykiss]|uniref:Ig-like domain-containing protein n=1 Tax=Oncorhynchus mykiss TaxID=8022 RepID=A0A060WBH6_ONCMY|nr:unnamed protein product [Oncorhynchus mykiss]
MSYLVECLGIIRNALRPRWCERRELHDTGGQDTKPLKGLRQLAFLLSRAPTETNHSARMNRAGLCFTLLLLGCVHGGKPSQKDVVFSRGIQLFVEGLNPSDPSVLILSSFGSDPGASHTPMLVCVLSGLHTHLVDIIWWINNTVVTPENNVVWSSRGSNGTYTATGLWTVSGKDWKPQNYYQCGTRHEGKLYINVTQSSLCRDFT